MNVGPISYPLFIPADNKAKKGIHETQFAFFTAQPALRRQGIS